MRRHPGEPDHRDGHGTRAWKSESWMPRSMNISLADQPDSRLTLSLAEPGSASPRSTCAGQIATPSSPTASWRALRGSRTWTPEPSVVTSSNRSEEHTSELQSLMRTTYAD